MIRRIVLAMAIVIGGCSAVPDATMCAHCACTPADRGVTRPLSCSTVRRDVPCCVVVLPSS